MPIILSSLESESSFRFFKLNIIAHGMKLNDCSIDFLYFLERATEHAAANIHSVDHACVLILP